MKDHRAIVGDSLVKHSYRVIIGARSNDICSNLWRAATSNVILKFDVKMSKHKLERMFRYCILNVTFKGTFYS